MPAKTPADEALKADSHVKILVELIWTAKEFTADTTQMAEVCGLTAAKNVPRKVNAIIGPYGYELKSGKIVNKDGSDSGKNDKSADNAKAPPMTPKTPKTPRASKPKTSAKKRKLDQGTAEEDEDEEEEAIKEEKDKGEIVKEEAVNEGSGMKEKA